MRLHGDREEGPTRRTPARRWHDDPDRRCTAVPSSKRNHGEGKYVMEPTDSPLAPHVEWAPLAVRVTGELPAQAQRNLWLHLFTVVSESESSGDQAVALQLCRDLHATIRLHSDERYTKAIHGAEPADRNNAVSLEDALAALPSLG
jgi:hypothetical protein